MGVVKVSGYSRIGQEIAGRIERPTAKALTRTAADVKAAEVAEMSRVFDRPTPYTLRGVYMRGASVDKGRDYAEVWLKDFGGKGGAAAVYLKPQIEGGGRPLKRFERALQRAGVLPAGMYAVPGRDADRDAYGNMSRAQIVQILSYFNGLHDSTQWMSDRRKKTLARDGKRGKGFTYFVLHQRKNKLPPGVYKRLDYGHGQVVIRPVLIFVRQPRYTARYRFHDVGGRVVADRFPVHLRVAWGSGR
ncbi:hypothetical protein C2134_02875 [Chromobacterium sinusclupearum]|uniref:Uncharacterized protein n=1 Tax=Chromobacterium sinusclupearum TaxID=2077146 RepID=A0A2K4MSR8_9NEIS|nr:hypothetical protein [Chromobacterium sinusclupearum]POB00152.1 hypothetical protein C2134_02875 [Chromobacterium sinusclupearum]